MGNLLKSELFKLRHDKSFYTLLFALIASAVFYPMIIFFDEGALGVQSISVNDLFIYTALGGNNYIVKLVPCILAGFFISSEYSMGTMKSIVASGNCRIRIYFAKLIVFSIGTVILSLVFPMVLTGVSAFLFGFNEMPELDYFIRTIGLTILYASAFASIMALFSIIFTDSGKTIGFLLIFFLLFDSILYVLSQKFTFIEIIFNYSVFKLFLDIGEVTVGNSELLKLVVVPILTFLAFGILGSYVFQKKEIK